MRCAALWYAQQKLHLVHKTAFPSHRLPFPGTVPGRSATARSVIYLRSGHGRAGAQVAAAAPRYAAPGTAEAPLRKRLPKPRLGEDTASPANGPRRQLLPPGSVPGGCCCRLPPPPPTGPSSPAGCPLRPRRGSGRARRQRGDTATAARPAPMSGGGAEERQPPVQCGPPAAKLPAASPPARPPSAAAPCPGSWLSRWDRPLSHSGHTGGSWRGSSRAAAPCGRGCCAAGGLRWAAGGRWSIPCPHGDAGAPQRLPAGEEVIDGGWGGSGAPADCGSAACVSGRAGSRCQSPPPARRPASTRPCRLRVPARSALRAAGGVTHAEPRASSGLKPSPRARRDAASRERKGGWEERRTSPAPQLAGGWDRELLRGTAAPVLGPTGETLKRWRNPVPVEGRRARAPLWISALPEARPEAWE